MNISTKYFLLQINRWFVVILSVNLFICDKRNILNPIVWDQDIVYVKDSMKIFERFAPLWHESSTSWRSERWGWKYFFSMTTKMNWDKLTFEYFSTHSLLTVSHRFTLVFVFFVICSFNDVSRFPWWSFILLLSVWISILILRSSINSALLLIFFFNFFQ